MRGGQHKTIIIKKAGRRRGGEQGGSGGAWKVAFADFTMAMMALFLILWILSSSSEEERHAVSSALRSYSFFDGQPNPFQLGNSPYPFDLEGYPSVVEGVAAELLTSGNHGTGMSMYNQQLEDGSRRSGTGDGNSLDSLLDSDLHSRINLNVLADVLEAMGRQLGAADNLAVDVVPQGLRVRLQDNDNRHMFERSSTTINPFFEDMLLAIAPVFSRINNSLILSGHTDAAQFPGSEYTNWELSSERANRARRLLIAGGAPDNRFLQVVGMSDRAPVYRDNPYDSNNRRIEILILTDDAEGDLLKLFDQDMPGNALQQARDNARSNLPVTR